MPLGNLATKIREAESMRPVLGTKTKLPLEEGSTESSEVDRQKTQAVGFDKKSVAVAPTIQEPLGRVAPGRVAEGVSKPDPRETKLAELLEKLKVNNNDWRLETALRLRERKNISIEVLIHAAKLLLVDDWRYRLAAKDTLFSYTSPFSPSGELYHPERYGQNKEEEE